MNVFVRTDLAEKSVTENHLWKQHVSAQRSSSRNKSHPNQTQADSRQVCLKILYNHFKLTTGATPRIPPSLTCLFTRSNPIQLWSIEMSSKWVKCQWAAGWWIVFFISALQYFQQQAWTPARLQLSAAVMKSDSTSSFVLPIANVI